MTTTPADILRALPDDKLVGFASPVRLAAAMRAMSDHGLASLFEAFVYVEPDLDTPLPFAPTEPDADEDPKPRAARKPSIEITDEAAALIGTHVDAGRDTIAKISEETGFDPDFVKLALVKLCDTGLVQRTGRGRGVTYTPVQGAQ